MIIEYVRYRIADEARRPVFEEAYAAASAALDQSLHCLAYDLSRCHEEPARYILRIHWDSLDGHLQGFRKSAEFTSFLSAVKPFIDDIEEMQHYEATSVTAPESIYDAVGGASTFFRLARRMHETMKDDAVVGPLFVHAAPTHVPHLAMWLCEVFGGPKLYSETLDNIGPILRRHAGQDIAEEQRAAFAACAKRAVDAIIEDPRAAEAIARYMEWGTHVAVDNSKADHVPDTDAGVPTWDWDSTS